MKQKERREWGKDRETERSRAKERERERERELNKTINNQSNSFILKEKSRNI